jgi:hypothetical protein
MAVVIRLVFFIAMFTLGNIGAQGDQK